MLSAEKIIKLFKMKSLPGEGGYFIETYRAKDIIKKLSFSDGYSSDRNLSTAIFYLLTPDTCSVLHKLPADEIFHFYLGDSVTMLQLKNGRSKIITIGQNILKGENLQLIVPKNTWQGMFLKKGGKFALMGTTVSPGFEFSDCKFACREKLIKQYPGQKKLIIHLTK